MLPFIERQRRNDCVNPSSKRVELCAFDFDQDVKLLRSTKQG